MTENDDAAAFQALERARELANSPAARRRAGTRRRKEREAGGVAGTEAGPGLGYAGSGARPSRRDPQPIGAVADALIAARGWDEKVEQAAVVVRWREIVGEEIADHTTIESLEDRKLVIRASSTAWATNLRLLTGTMRTRIAEVAGPELVEEIVILAPAGPSWKHGIRSVPGRGPRDTYG